MKFRISDDDIAVLLKLMSPHGVPAGTIQNTVCGCPSAETMLNLFVTLMFPSVMIAMSLRTVIVDWLVIPRLQAGVIRTTYFLLSPGSRMKFFVVLLQSLNVLMV